MMYIVNYALETLKIPIGINNYTNLSTIKVFVFFIKYPKKGFVFKRSLSFFIFKRSLAFSIKVSHESS